MKKIIAIALFVMFIISLVPLAFAEEGTGDRIRDKTRLEHAKNYLLRIADTLINHFEKIKAIVQESSEISDDMKARIVAKIDAQIAEINIIKAEIEAATTKEQIKDAAKKLRDIWDRFKHIARLHAGRVVSARVEGLVNEGIVQ